MSTIGQDWVGPHRVRFSFDGAPLEAPRGMTIGGALLANGNVSWRRTRVEGRRAASSAASGAASIAWWTWVTSEPCGPA